MNCPSCGCENPAEASFCMACTTSLVLLAEQALSSSQVIPVSSGFVGRQRELGELRAALEESLIGHGQLVMLVGEPGIGKTRTAQELADYALNQGSQVLWGRCHDQPGMLPFWPWVQAIRSYVRHQQPDQLRSEMGPGAADIAQVVPELKEQLSDIQPPPTVEPDQARFRLFDSLATFLKTASQSQPLVIILDNLHWADQPSLRLLEFLGQEMEESHLLIVGTYRDIDLSRHHPLSEALGELTRDPSFQRFVLGGLGLEEVGSFLQSNADGEIPEGLTEIIHSHTEGNPLFVTEVVRMLQQEGRLTPRGTPRLGGLDIRIPQGVREVIGRRLNRLSDGCNEVLTMASVIGREFEASLLGHLTEEVSEDQLLALLEEAVAARVIEEVPQVLGRYQFNHVLIKEALAEGLSATRRVRLHGIITELMEDLYSENMQYYAAELAYHCSQA
ncbi:MAG: AAA family ATPase, partial [Dehalococcoidia bacterium]